MNALADCSAQGEIIIDDVLIVGLRARLWNHVVQHYRRLRRLHPWTDILLHPRKLREFHGGERFLKVIFEEANGLQERGVMQRVFQQFGQI